MFAKRFRHIALGVVILAMSEIASPQSLPRFDWTKTQEVQQWQPTHDVAALKHTAEGMLVTITGGDPYITGPARDFPAGQPLWLRLRLKSEQGGMAQVFYFERGATEENSVRFPVRKGVWDEVRVPLPPLGAGYRLRFDPPGTGGTCILASLSFELRVLLKEPQWFKPVAPDLKDHALSFKSGDLEFAHARNQWGGFELSVAGEPMAVGFTRPLIGYTMNNEVHWLNLAENAKVESKQEKDLITITATARDADGATWTLRQQFVAEINQNAVRAQTSVTVNQPRSVVFLPMLVMCPGVGSFGESKAQGLFAGLEYLDNEPSSSEADVIGPGSKRQVPDSLKVTFPLMAIQARDRYVGLIWEQAPHLSAMFDSPDRLFQSGGHVMGVIFPGSNGGNRVEGNLLPYDAEVLAAGKPLTLKATLIGGRGKSVVPALQQYVKLRGLPSVPPVGSLQDYVKLTTSGWLDSKGREGALFRHAYVPSGSFGAHPAADAAWMMEWLANESKDAALSQRLRDAAKEAIAKVPPHDYDFAGVSHVRYPIGSLLYGHVAESTQRMSQHAQGLLSRFEKDGAVLYRKAPDRPDFGTTHFERTANGLTAQVVVSLLEAATFCGDKQLIAEGLRRLRALDKFSNTVPRGAQTWEIPLHTPDVLASAHLVRAYTLGYELTGDAHFLEQAKDWAWTGVPFVYLVNPTGQAVGTYATIAVLGATHWKAPVWMGLPVQWCGLVYADALYRLHRHDPSGIWKTLADGITASGVQQTYPIGHATSQGLLPDSFNLRPQTRNMADINPGTVQANAVRLFNGRALYDFRVFRASGVMVHAPGAMDDVKEETQRVSFTVQGWSPQPYHVLIVGLTKTPRVRLNGQDAPLTEPHQFMEKEGRLILQVMGSPRIEIVR